MQCNDNPTAINLVTKYEMTNDKMSSCKDVMGEATFHFDSLNNRSDVNRGMYQMKFVTFTVLGSHMKMI